MSTVEVCGLCGREDPLNLDRNLAATVVSCCPICYILLEIPVVLATANLSQGDRDTIFVLLTAICSIIRNVSRRRGRRAMRERSRSRGRDR